MYNVNYIYYTSWNWLNVPVINTRGWSLPLTPGDTPLTPLYWRAVQARGTQLRNRVRKGRPFIPKNFPLPPTN